MMKFSSLVLMIVALASTMNMFECARQNSTADTEPQGKGTTAATPQKEKLGLPEGAIKQLAAGNNCSVFESFVFVARDRQTYQALMSLDINLPDQDAEFFNSQMVIAAFLGQRRTGGFAVEITQGADGNVLVAERAPKAMVTTSLTTPFKIVALPVKPDGTVSLTVDKTWQDRLRTYRLVSGELTITGGFAGIQQTATLAGSLQVMRERRLATIFFELKSTGKRSAQVSDVASGTVANSGQLSFSYLDSHKLSGAIQSPFKATGQFINEERELGLSLETVPSPHISDNFNAIGSLQALASTPKPANRAITGSQ